VVDYGSVGLDGSRVFLYRPPTGNLLGELPGAALALNDNGDVIYSQLASSTSVLLRKVDGAKFDLGDYIRNPVNTRRELNHHDILGMNTSGWILVVQAIDATDSNRNVVLLTPE